jgi:acyl-coenzyme A synthetase/AMP-(fatty) acid ligase/acyl carrier protein
LVDVDVFCRVSRPDARLIVGIGATECGGNFAHWFVDERLRGAGTLLPIGRVLPDAQVTIVGDDGNPVAEGETGEFVVASRYVALGYWREPEQTARAFTTDPVDPSIRHYQTGDFGRRRPDGLLEFLGRIDDRIKLRGHRIELAEIEAALLAIPEIKDVGIVIRRSETGLPRSLIAYIEHHEKSAALNSRDLRSRLAERLPRYMVPASIVVVEALPRLLNLKIDRARLAAIDDERCAAAPTPDDPLLKEVLQIFDRVIGGPKATPDDNVASLGGDSLQAVMVAVAIEKHFSLALPPRLFDETETIRDLTGWIERHRDRSAAADCGGCGTC